MDKEKWSRMPEEETIKDTIKAIKSRGVNVILVENREAALNKLKEIIPAGAEVMNGSSTTLDEIGFVDLLSSGKH
ncbi:MAG TPA: LUD domain-containing protein, partial [Candidatus Nanoarchaeia archaeon]|nr:LUD domain-containing protein [Candidatus Nanoarchaeia archaeon]